MSGALVMASGISFLFGVFHLKLVVIGYIIMRLAMIALWLRAARGDHEHSATAYKYAFGIGLAQIYWVIFYQFQPLEGAALYGFFFLGALIELAVPVIAERGNMTPWHRHHIQERYGLLNIIVLGETLLAGSIALQAIAQDHFDTALMHTVASALVIVFAMWWIYFTREDHLVSSRPRHAFLWGYGHFVIFASGAAVGAGFAALVDIFADHAEVSRTVGVFAVAVPVSLYMIGLWFVRDRFGFDGMARFVLPVFALLILVVPLTPLALEGIAALLVLSAVIRNVAASRERVATA
jgi:low temperature requirement protein LtrA